MEEQPQSFAWRKRLILMLLILVGVSIAARVYTAPDEDKQEAKPLSGAATQLVEQEQPPPAARHEPPPWLAKVLPFVTEGGIAMLLGIAFGVATRSVMRLLLLLVVVVVVAIQVLAYKGVLQTPDWSVAGDWIYRFVLNVTAEADLPRIVQHKLPSAGTFILGCLIGFKRG